MPAPEVSAFGDGSHAPGATSLTIDGGGFGAFPGSAWIYENDDLTGDADELTVGSWNDLQLSVDIPSSLNNAPGTRYLFVQREDLAWSNAFAFTLEGVGVTLTVQDASHGHSVDSPTLSTGVTLVVADALHGHAAESPALMQASSLTVQDAAHGHAAENVDVSTGVLLVVADALHAHIAENAALIQANLLTAQDALHAHTADAVALILGVALQVEGGLHGHAADNVALRLPGRIPPPSRVLIVDRPGDARRIAS